MDISTLGPTALTFSPVLIGALLLLWGKRLYWLALGVLGFMVGQWLAQDVLALGRQDLELAISIVLSILGAVLAIFAQKIAIRLGGFLAGGALAFWIATPYQAELGPALWVTLIIGAVIGMVLAMFLFSAALILVSSLVGAQLIAHHVFSGPPREIWAFLILFGLGVLVQSRGRKRRLDG